MAAYFLAAIPLIILFLFTMRLFVKGLSQGAIKG
jgi:ABC-type glycerol-3-phosphate transport system permease component